MSADVRSVQDKVPYRPASPRQVDRILNSSRPTEALEATC
jgi:hypothetical protein